MIQNLHSPHTQWCLVLKEGRPALKEFRPALKEVLPAPKEVPPALKEVRPALKEVRSALKKVPPALKNHNILRISSLFPSLSLKILPVQWGTVKELEGNL